MLHVRFCLGSTPNYLIVYINNKLSSSGHQQNSGLAHAGVHFGQLAACSSPELPHTISSYNGTYLSGVWFGVICSVHFYAHPPKPYKDEWGKLPLDLIPVQAYCDPDRD